MAVVCGEQPHEGLSPCPSTGLPKATLFPSASDIPSSEGLLMVFCLWPAAVQDLECCYGCRGINEETNEPLDPLV